MQELRAPQVQTADPAMSVLAAIGKPALAALGLCSREEHDDEVRARCTRALGLTKLAEAKEQLVALAGRDDLHDRTVAELAIALSSAGDLRALTLLARFVHGDDPSSHSAATALFELDPAYYQRLPESSQVAYALAIADAGWLKTQHAQTFSAHAPALAKILSKRMRSGQLELNGKAIGVGRWFLLLGRLGSADNAPEVVAMAQSLASEAARSAALDLLAQWRSPLGLSIAVTMIREGLSQNQKGRSPALASAGRYLHTLANQQDAAAQKAIGALWLASDGRNGIRCELVFGYASMTPAPPASEVAALLASPCRHDLTILLDRPERGLIDGLVAFLHAPAADAETVRLAREALAWQCAGRLRSPLCQKAAPLLRGVPRPSHPD
jgi:hypothetical protein